MRPQVFSIIHRKTDMGWVEADKDFDLTRPFAMSTLKGVMILGLERGWREGPNFHTGHREMSKLKENNSFVTLHGLHVPSQACCKITTFAVVQHQQDDCFHGSRSVFLPVVMVHGSSESEFGDGPICEPSVGHSSMPALCCLYLNLHCSLFDNSRGATRLRSPLAYVEYTGMGQKLRSRGTKI